MSSPSAQPSTGAALPALVVPLEGVLLRTDPLLDAALVEARRSPPLALRLVAGRIRGRAVAARMLARSRGIDPRLLAYDEPLLARLRQARDRGQTLVLVSQEDSSLALSVAAHLGFFDAVIAPGPPDEENVQERVQRAFPSHEVARASTMGAGRRLRALVRSLRPHQWTKNALIFVPALLAHATQPEVWFRALWAFAAFSLCASSVYVLNDLLDLHADRAHPSKKRRPFASGDLPLGIGMLLAPVLLGGAVALALALPPAFAAVLGIYYGSTLAYSLFLKRLALVDVLLLAGLYSLRLIAGGVAYEVPLSQWLLAFALFLFVSLAFVKRTSEIQMVRREGRQETAGRGYLAGDMELLSTLGAAAGYLSVLVLALYLNSEDVRRLYAHPARLWVMLPLLLYWISRVWLLAHRGQMHDDPIVFAIRDPPSYLVALGAAAALVLAH
jgi:4-hydroxybenzoate polyprenyltransferase